MQTLIQAKFLAIDQEQLKHRLASLSASLETSKRNMHNVVFDYPDHRLENADNGSVRVRDASPVVTLNYTRVTEQREGGIKHVELVVDSFEKAVNFLEGLGLKALSIQQFRREIWQLGNVRVLLDEWPWIKPFAEIEGPSEAAIRDISARLGFSWSQAVFGSTTIAYAAEFPGIRLDHNETIAKIPQIEFDTPLPSWLKQRQVL